MSDLCLAHQIEEIFVVLIEMFPVIGGLHKSPLGSEAPELLSLKVFCCFLKIFFKYYIFFLEKERYQLSWECWIS